MLCIAERICADNYKELLEKGKDSNGEEVFGEMLDDLLYLAELIDLWGLLPIWLQEEH